MFKLLAVTLAGLFLTGCAAQTKNIKLSCFKDDAHVATIEKDVKTPVILDKGCVIFYGNDGKLYRVCDNACGFKVAE